MDVLKPPDRIRLDGDVSKRWKLFKQKFELFLTSSEASGKPRTGATKVALLLSVAGDEALEVYNNFSFTEGDSKNDLETVVKKFDEYCEAQLNEVHERFVFRQRVQAGGESAEQLVRDLRRLAQSCNFGTMSESMIRDQSVYGTSNEKVREKL